MRAAKRQKNWTVPAAQRRYISLFIDWLTFAVKTGSHHSKHFAALITATSGPQYLPCHNIRFSTYWVSLHLFTSPPDDVHLSSSLLSSVISVIFSHMLAAEFILGSDHLMGFICFISIGTLLLTLESRDSICSFHCFIIRLSHTKKISPRLVLIWYRHWHDPRTDKTKRPAPKTQLTTDVNPSIHINNHYMLYNLFNSISSSVKICLLWVF